MGESFEEYVTGRGPALLRVAYLLTQDRHRDRHRAEDLLQEVLVKAHRRWRRIDAPDRYVRRAILHEYLSWRRRRSSHEAVLDALPDTAAPGDGGDAMAGLDRWHTAFYVQLDPDHTLMISGSRTELDQLDILGIAQGLTLRGR